jgi:uncharacterized membrane protein
LEAFSDGVFAIAITLLVLDLAIGADAADDLVSAILAEWPSYLAYVTSFLTIGAVWMVHSRITNALRAADGTLYRLNLLVLLIASFLPFPTRLVSEFIDDEGPVRVAVVFYGLVLLALSLSMTVVARYAFEGRRLVKETIDDATVAGVMAGGTSFAFYAIAIAVGIWQPTLAVGLYLVIALYLSVPFRTIRRLVRR